MVFEVTTGTVSVSSTICTVECTKMRLATARLIRLAVQSVKLALQHILDVSLALPAPHQVSWKLEQPGVHLQDWQQCCYLLRSVKDACLVLLTWIASVRYDAQRDTDTQQLELRGVAKAVDHLVGIVVKEVVSKALNLIPEVTIGGHRVHL